MIEKEYKKFEKIESSEYGICHILNKNENVYLMYSEEMYEPFLVCKSDGENLFYRVRSFYSLESAIVVYKRLGNLECPL